METSLHPQKPLNYGIHLDLKLLEFPFWDKKPVGTIVRIKLNEQLYLKWAEITLKTAFLPPKMPFLPPKRLKISLLCGL